MATAFSYRNKGSDSSDSDSDDSDKECRNWKRATKNKAEVIEKIPIAPPPVEPLPAQEPNNLKRKRNNIWCEVLEDQMMSETLKDCGIKNKPKGFGSRGAESYDFTAGKNLYDDDGSDEVMSDDSRTHYSNRHKRFKKDNYVEVDDAEKAAALKIIRVLSEPKKYLIYRIVKYLGTEKALKLLKMTEDIEENGGMMIKNQIRRRTPGGVYLQLLRSDNTIGKEVIDKIFEGELNSYEKKKKFDEIRNKKGNRNRRNRKKKKRNSNDKMEVENPDSNESSPEDSKDSVVANMEEDKVGVIVDATVVTSINSIPDAIVKEETSDLEEGEVE